MGKGAYVQIANASNQDVSVSYPEMNCMYTDGTDGSNFANITGVIPSGASFPRNATSQYIEAIASGSCASEESYFHMALGVVTNAPTPPAKTYSFIESQNAYTLNDGSSYATATVDGFAFTATIVENGDQYYITVTIVNA